MSDQLGRYHFLAWARRGIGGSVANPDQGSLPARANLGIQLFVQVQGGSSANPVPSPLVNVNLFGPGDVVGIDPRYVIRTDPRPFTVNYEPNYLCGIEFDTPNFPWLFTPAAADGDRLRPWVALIALKDTEFSKVSIAPNPLPAIDVNDLAGLHDLSLSWNWAHVQVTGDATLADTLASDPGHVISRLLSPRRLEPDTSYTASLVPAFHIGVVAGLNAGDVSGISASDPAWTSATHAPLRLPYYYSFEFSTSDEGDFESLVRALKPTVLPATVGAESMDVDHAAAGIPAAGGPLALEGALESISTKPTNWTGAAKVAFQTAVQTLINQSGPTTDDPAHPNPKDPVIVPPIYGRWQAGAPTVNRNAAGWLNELNLDPRNRSNAGMGTQVVQEERTQLMASAWQQVSGVLEANQMLRQAQLARAAMQQVYRQHLQPAQPEKVLNLTTPLHARILASPTTVKAALRSSRVPERMLSGTFRRVARLPVRRAVKTGPPSLLSNVSSGAIAIVPPPKAPGGMVAIDQIAKTTSPSPTAPPPPAAPTEILFKNFTAKTVTDIPSQPAFQITNRGDPFGGGPSAGPDSAPAAAFRAATGRLFTEFERLPADAQPAAELDIAALSSAVLARTNPVDTIPRRVRSLIFIPDKLPWQPVDPLETIMAAPEFPQPMYAPLRDLSPAYLLPGVDRVPVNSVGLLQTNQRFIESYMAGLNHELSRQLLCNSYPTDQRGSYFRQFWDVSAYIPQPADPPDPAQLAEKLKDIQPMHTWKLPSALGTHPGRTDVVPNNVVLLVRGELFKRYPNAIVYAGKATRDAQGRRVLDESDERYPLFRGTIPPDMTFLGFNLAAADARGGTAASPDGFFFVFQEQPSEPRFGLEPTAAHDPVSRWSDLAWTNFKSGTGSPAVPLPVGNRTQADVLAQNPWRLASQVFGLVQDNAPLPGFLSPNSFPAGVKIPLAVPDANNTWGQNSAETAYILLRLPFRVLIHADLMLPK
jgi:hypothetical protein